MSRVLITNNVEPRPAQRVSAQTKTPVSVVQNKIVVQVRSVPTIDVLSVQRTKIAKQRLHRSVCPMFVCLANRGKPDLAKSPAQRNVM